MAEAQRAVWMRLLGVGVLVVGVIGGLVLWWFAGKRYDDAVADLAPAPIGCDTTLEFDRTGTFTLFLETRGSVGEIDGDCDADDRSYDLGDADPPRVSLTLLDENGEEIDLDRADGPDYDRAGSRGSGYRTVDIEGAGDYVLIADAPASDVMIRVGRDPASGVTPMRIGAVIVVLAGLVLGVLALVLTARRTSTGGPPVAEPATAWPPAGARVPPTAPPYANPPVPPPYASVPRPVAQPPARPPGGWPGTGRPLPPPPPPPPRSG